MTVKASPTARRTARQTSMSTAGSVGGWILYAVQPSALKRAASSAYAFSEGRTADDAYAGTLVRYDPSSLWDRQPRDLAGEVPQRDVHRPDRAVRGVADLLRHRLVEPLAIERILAEHERLEIVDQRRRVHLRAAHGRAEEGVTLHALVGADREQPELARAAEPAGVAPV